MNVPRRIFLRSATLTAVAATVAAGNASLTMGQKRGQASATVEFPVPIEAQKDFIFHSSYSTFAPYVNSIFTARGANGAMMEMKLLRVTQYIPQANTKISTVPSRYYTDCCSLMFRAPAPLATFSTITTLRHAALGRLDLFLSPHGEDADGLYYEAVINHVTSTPPKEFR